MCMNAFIWIWIFIWIDNDNTHDWINNICMHVCVCVYEHIRVHVFMHKKQKKSKKQMWIHWIAALHPAAALPPAPFLDPKLSQIPSMSPSQALYIPMQGKRGGGKRGGGEEEKRRGGEELQHRYSVGGSSATTSPSPAPDELSVAGGTEAVYCTLGPKTAPTLELSSNVKVTTQTQFHCHILWVVTPSSRRGFAGGEPRRRENGNKNVT